MYSAISFEFNDDSATQALVAAQDALKDVRKPLSILRRGLERRMNDQLYQTKVSAGGDVRGEHWDPMAPYHVRKDGTVIPAWGGVPKVRGEGTVLGRKRHGSAGRVEASKRFLDPWRGQGVFRYVAMNKDAMTLSTSKAPQVAFFNQARQFLFWNEADATELPKILQVWIDRHLEKARA